MSCLGWSASKTKLTRFCHALWIGSTKRWRMARFFASVPTPTGIARRCIGQRPLAAGCSPGSESSYEWDLARCFEEARWRFPERPWPTNEIVRERLDDDLAFTIGAGPHAKVEFGPENDIYMAGIERYERWTGKSGPVKLGGTLKPRDFGYALCRHYTAIQSFDEDALVAAGRKMLRAHL